MRIPVERGMKGLSYTLLGAGVLMLALLRILPEHRPWFDEPAALGLIAASCLLYAVLPRIAEIQPQAAAMLGHYGVHYRPIMGRLVNAAAGVILAGLAFYLAS